MMDVYLVPETESEIDIGKKIAFRECLYLFLGDWEVVAAVRKLAARHGVTGLPTTRQMEARNRAERRAGS